MPGEENDFHFGRARARALGMAGRRGKPKEPPTERPQERVKISLDHFDRAGSPLCAYYVFIMAAYQEARDKTIGASRQLLLLPPPRDSLETVPRNVRESWGPGQGAH